ncbi:MAG: hypothetical protein JKY17_06350 [Magnetovibrio sp.]|nr:hypothetical protein [Magnetovibrio sp.]
MGNNVAVKAILLLINLQDAVEIKKRIKAKSLLIVMIFIGRRPLKIPIQFVEK